MYSLAMHLLPPAAETGTAPRLRSALVAAASATPTGLGAPSSASLQCGGHPDLDSMSWRPSHAIHSGLSSTMSRGPTDGFKLAVEKNDFCLLVRPEGHFQEARKYSTASWAGSLTCRGILEALDPPRAGGGPPWRPSGLVAPTGPLMGQEHRKQDIWTQNPPPSKKLISCL